MPKLGPNFYTSTWERIKDRLDPEHPDDTWEIAIAGIEGRFRERFEKPADAIQDLDKKDSSLYAEGRGFSIVAIDCLLLEALHGYEQGKRTKDSKKTGKAFEKLLTSKTEFFGDVFKEGTRARTFGSAVRNGILHDGETRDGWLVRQGKPNGQVVTAQGEWQVLNRDAFHTAVKKCLADYFARLRSADDPKHVELRRAFKDRVDVLCKESEPPTTASTR
ncbi:MAG: hypothetical protein KGK34_02205 [Chloroflexota bacterium]|nr:hypothetical protein [Chloroflexota bacterium]